MRERLAHRPDFDYQVQRSNFVWRDHVERLLVTGSVIAWLGPDTVCDPACGDASVLEAAYRQRPFRTAFLGDISGPNIDALDPSFPVASALCAPADEMLATLASPVDCIVLTEILEHLEDPDALLRLARAKGKMLVASSPCNEAADSDNAEHLWRFDIDGYAGMLIEAGWTITSLNVLSWPNYPYQFQIWSAG